jgi:hypothetical protein
MSGGRLTPLLSRLNIIPLRWSSSSLTNAQRFIATKPFINAASPSREVLYVLIPLSLVLMDGAVWALLWAVDATRILRSLDPTSRRVQYCSRPRVRTRRKGPEVAI